MVVVSRILGYKSAGAPTIIAGETAGQQQELLRPASIQLTEAIKTNDALFMVEEQNLFIDEVRDTKRWLGVFESLQWEENGVEVAGTMRDWVLEGLEHIHGLIDLPDGPLGWSSDPHVFAICSQVLLAARTLERMELAGSHLEGVLVKFRASIATNKNHFSGLLEEMISR